MFSSSSQGLHDQQADQYGQRLRHSPDPDQHQSSADPLRTDFGEYDDGQPRFNSNLSAAAGYQSVDRAGDASEPGSPTHGGEGYERSNESGSSGTKVEPGQRPRPDTMSSEGSYENGGGRQGGNHTVRLRFLPFPTQQHAFWADTGDARRPGTTWDCTVGQALIITSLSSLTHTHTHAPPRAPLPRFDAAQSESGHAYNGDGMYDRTNNSSTGYVDASLYHPSSPDSRFGRYREGSFGHASGLESGRASTIGTDHNPSNNIPYNSSRVALNNEWRNSYDQGSNMSRDMTIAEIAPGKEQYGRHDSRYDDEIEKSPLAGDGQKYVPIAPGSPAIGHGDKGAFPQSSARDPPAVVISRTNRLEWIDGLRGIASVIIFTHHFSDLTWSQSHPNTLAEGSLEGFLRLVLLIEPLCTKLYLLSFL